MSIQPWKSSLSSSSLYYPLLKTASLQPFCRLQEYSTEYYSCIGRTFVVGIQIREGGASLQYYNTLTHQNIRFNKNNLEQWCFCLEDSFFGSLNGLPSFNILCRPCMWCHQGCEWPWDQVHSWSRTEYQWHFICRFQIASARRLT